MLFVSLLIQLIAKFHHSFPEDETTPICTITGFHGVTVSTQDSESCDPSSNLGGTLVWIIPTISHIWNLTVPRLVEINVD